MVKRWITFLLLVISCAAFAQVDEGAAQQLFDRINRARAEAERGQMQASTLVRRWKDVRSVFTFTAAEPQKLPHDLVRTAPEATSFAVGSCFGKNERYPEGTNWVVVAFY